MITREQIESLDEKIPGGFTPIDNLSFDDIADLKRLALLGLSMQQPISGDSEVTREWLSGLLENVPEDRDYMKPYHFYTRDMRDMIALAIRGLSVNSEVPR